MKGPNKLLGEEKMKSTYTYLNSSRDGAKRLEWIVGHNHNVLYSIDDFISVQHLKFEYILVSAVVQLPTHLPIVTGLSCDNW